MNKLILVLLIVDFMMPARFLSAMEKGEQSKETPIYEMIAERMANETFKSCLCKLEEDESSLIKRYQGYEDRIDEYKKKIRAMPRRKINGGIDFFMPVAEITSHVGTKVEKKIKTLAELKKLGEGAREYFRHGSTKLTRIWGAKFLKEEKKENKSLANFFVPNYFLVPDGNKEDIGIDIDLDDITGPVVAGISGARIYAELIDGTPVTGIANLTQEEQTKEDTIRQTLFNVGFSDFGTGNVLEEKQSKKFFVVDTEEKSFQAMDNIQLPEAIRYYIFERFKIKNGIPKKSRGMTVYPFKNTAPKFWVVK